MHSLTIDITEPAAAEAFADCAVGDTYVITVTGKEPEVSVSVDIEKGDYEEAEAAPEPAAKPALTGPPAKGMAKAY